MFLFVLVSNIFQSLAACHIAQQLQPRRRCTHPVALRIIVICPSQTPASRARDRACRRAPDPPPQDMIELMDTAGSGMVSKSEFCRSVPCSAQIQSASPGSVAACLSPSQQPRSRSGGRDGLRELQSAAWITAAAGSASLPPLVGMLTASTGFGHSELFMEIGMATSSSQVSNL